MKLQFSLATLLVCVTVLAVTFAICKQVPVFIKDPFGPPLTNTDYSQYFPPSMETIAWRFAWAGPLAIAGTLAVLWAIRRLKSRRENGQPGYFSGKMDLPGKARPTRTSNEDARRELNMESPIEPTEPASHKRSGIRGWMDVLFCFICVLLGDPSYIPGEGEKPDSEPPTRR